MKHYVGLADEVKRFQGFICCLSEF